MARQGNKAVGSISVITFPELGVATRLGNHLFQMAATITMAMDHGEDYGFPRWVHEKDFPLSGCFLDALPSGPEYREPAFSYDPIPYQPNLRLYGYFQSEKYFVNHADFIRKSFTPLVMTQKKDYRDTASLQIRRGNYLKQQHLFPVLPVSYYEAAVDYLRSRHSVDRVLVLSDDLPWCREHFRNAPYEVIPDMSPARHLAVTASCRYHVMANSTFSWWGAWLDPNPNKIVIAPKLWFGPAYSHYNTKDLLPPEWIVV